MILVMGYSSIRPVHRIKHVKDSNFGTMVNTQVNVDLITSVDAPVLASTDQVETGSKVNGIYLKVEAVATGTEGLPNLYMMIVKNVGGNLTFPSANAVGANDNKRFVIHQEMVMLSETATGGPRTVFNGVVAIPKGYRRFGPNDLLQLYVISPFITTNVCVQCHYKEFR